MMLEQNYKTYMLQIYIYIYKNTGTNLQGLLDSGVQNFLQSKVQRKQKDLVHILPKSQMNGAMLLNDASIIFSAAYTYCHYKTLEYQKKNRYSQTYLYTTTQVLSVIWQKKKSISANIAFSSLDGFLDCYYVLQSHDPTLGIGHLLSLLFIASLFGHFNFPSSSNLFICCVIYYIFYQF